jgi:hypothetical protein
MKKIRRKPGEGEPYFEVNYYLVLQVIDRNLKWHVELKDNGEILDDSRGQISIAAAFLPGTK